MKTAIVLAVRVKDWVATGKKLPPWKVDTAICTFCGEEVIVTPDYATVVKMLGFEIKYICTQCYSERPVAA